MVPPENIHADITPLKFEHLVRDYLVQQGQNFKGFSTIHDIKLKGPDGEYQIDVYAEFDFLGTTFRVLAECWQSAGRVLAECKRYKNKVKRETVQLLYDKLRATGTHKGLLFSTSGFQEGAHKYADEHGIALIRVIENRFTYFTKSTEEQKFDPHFWFDEPKYVGEYKVGNITAFLQNDSLDCLRDFLFGSSNAE